MRERDGPEMPVACFGGRVDVGGESWTACLKGPWRGKGVARSSGAWIPMAGPEREADKRSACIGDIN